MTGRASGKVALVTGAARGQGRSHAIRLAEEGADIIAVDICAQIASVPYPMATPEDLHMTVKEVEARGQRIVAYTADVRDHDQLTAAIDDGVSKLGRLDIVCGNAGISSFGPTADIREDEWQDVIDVNQTGLWHTAKASIPHLRAAGGGSIIFTISSAGTVVYPGTGHYASSKHGAVGLMRALALELGPDHIRVNGIMPTQVNTPMLQNEFVWKLFCPDIESPTIEDFAPVSQTMNVLPVAWVEPEDISNAVVFLSSAEGRFITGITLPVDAGTVIK